MCMEDELGYAKALRKESVSDKKSLHRLSVSQAV